MSHIDFVLEGLQVIFEEAAGCRNVEVWTEPPDVSQNRVSLRGNSKQPQRSAMLVVRGLCNIRLLEHWACVSAHSTAFADLKGSSD